MCTCANGTISQKSVDGKMWEDIPGATMPQHEIIFSEGKDRTFYYRCMAENTRKGYQPAVIASECIKPV